MWTVFYEYSSIYAKDYDFIKFYLEKCLRAFSDFRSENVNSFVFVVEFSRVTFFISCSILINGISDDLLSFNIDKFDSDKNFYD